MLSTPRALLSLAATLRLASIYDLSLPAVAGARKQLLDGGTTDMRLPSHRGD